MNVKDLFRLIIKCFGLYLFLKSIFYLVPQNAIFLSPETPPSYFLYVLITTGIPLALFVALLLKPDLVISAFRLDKGFDNENVSIKHFSFLSMLHIFITLMGVWLFIESLLPFIRACFDAFVGNVSPRYPMSNEDNSLHANDYINWTYQGIGLFMGYLLSVNARSIAVFIEKIQNSDASGGDILDG